MDVSPEVQSLARRLGGDINLETQSGMIFIIIYLFLHEIVAIYAV